MTTEPKHSVMTRPPKSLYKKLEAIAQNEKRPCGPQALFFIEAGIDAYLEANPELKQQLEATG